MSSFADDIREQIEGAKQEPVTFDVTDAVQEICDRAGWGRGDEIPEEIVRNVIGNGLFDMLTSHSGQVIHFTDSEGEDQPILIIESDGEIDPSKPITMDLVNGTIHN